MSEPHVADEALVTAFTRIYDLVDQIVYMAGRTEDDPEAIREAYISIANAALALANDEEVGAIAARYYNGPLGGDQPTDY